MTTPPYPLPDPTSTAVAREAAWLAQSGDTLPGLLKTAGGPWDIVQAYWPGARFAQMKAGVYVTRRDIADQHPAAQRYRPRYLLSLKLYWPVKTPTAPIPETEQANFDAAVGLLLQRIRGLLGDKTHGGRFLSVAEVPEQQPVSVDFDDPETTLAAGEGLRATVTYYADDFEFNG
jgi:hypothetical protein